MQTKQQTQKVLLQVMLFIALAAGAGIFGTDYYQSHRSLDLKSLNRDRGRYTPQSELCGTQQTASGKVISVDPEFNDYTLSDDTDLLRVDYTGLPPSVNESVTVKGQLICVTESPGSIKIDHLELHEAKRAPK